METVMKSDIFFFVSTIAVIILTVLLIIVLCYIIGELRRFKKFSKKVEGNIAEVSGRVTESSLFNFLFRKKKAKKKEHKK